MLMEDVIQKATTNQYLCIIITQFLSIVIITKGSIEDTFFCKGVANVN